MYNNINDSGLQFLKSKFYNDLLAGRADLKRENTEKNTGTKSYRERNVNGGDLQKNKMYGDESDYENITQNIKYHNKLSSAQESLYTEDGKNSTPGTSHADGRKVNENNEFYSGKQKCNRKKSVRINNSRAQKKMGASGNLSRKEYMTLLKKLQKIDAALLETQFYLNENPKSAHAAEYYNNLLQKRNNLTHGNNSFCEKCDTDF